MWKPDKESGTPLYCQIAEYIRGQIKSGVLKSGEKISVRKYSDKCGVSRNTVIEAFDQLKSEGVLYAAPRSGTVVTPDAWSRLFSKTPDWGKLASTGHQMALSPEFASLVRRTTTLDTISLAGFSPNSDVFNTKQLLVDCLSSMESPDDIFNHAFDYSVSGLPHLRDAVAEHLKNYSIDVDPSNLILFNSGNVCMLTVCSAFIRRGMNFFVLENDLLYSTGIVPSYGGIIHVIPRKNNRYDFDIIRQKAKRQGNNFLYITALNHEPTGNTMSLEEHEELMDICIQKQIPVLENDIYRDLWVKPPVKPFKAFDKSDLVIYKGNFSCMAYSGLTAAWLAVPEIIKERICEVKTQFYGSNNTMLEQIAHQLLITGHYMRHMEKARENLARKIDRVDELLHKYFGEIAVWDKDKIVCNAWVTFTVDIDTDRLFKDCPEVCFGVGSALGDPYSSISLSIISPPLENIDKGLKLISRAAMKQL